MLGKKTSENNEQSAKSSLQVEKKDSLPEARFHDPDVEEDCPAGEEGPKKFLENNNSKDFLTDVSPDIPSDEDNNVNVNPNEIESVRNVQNESMKTEVILRKNSRDAEAQTKSRESRDSFRCRGCGVERNRQRFEEEMEGREFDRDHVNQRSMSETFKVCGIHWFFFFFFFEFLPEIGFLAKLKSMYS